MSRLKPGEAGKIDVLIDIRGKTGNVAKTVKVYSNDPKNPVVTLTLRMYIKNRVHLSPHEAAEIFGPNCSGCHVDEGKDKMGFDLFRADCFMCHNAGKNTSLSTMSKQPESLLYKAVVEGVNGTTMPGWALRKGGPLTDAQIRSLIELIKE